MRPARPLYLAVALLLSCRLSPAALAGPDAPPAPLGARFNADRTQLTFTVYSSRATRVEVCLYAHPKGEAEKLRRPLSPASSGGTWSVTLPAADLAAGGVTDTVYYGYRAWGPNWPFDPAWQKGTLTGFVKDADAAGNRFNPNKLLLDPYVREVSHDPKNPDHPADADYCSGDGQRATDTGPFAPKGIVLPPDAAPGDTGTKPTRPFKDEIIYEVHLRGLTKNDPSVPELERGTYAGAARKAAYLRSLGVTAAEFLPLPESQNDANDLVASTAGDNYWGYDPYNYFAPDRRYATDKSPGGPTREFKALVRAFHGQGLKVYVDMVYNHTGEGGVSPDGATARVLSWRGLDNAAYYELRSGDRRFYSSAAAVPGPNVNTAHPAVRREILDALAYWKDALGVDGFRFDLAPLLGNRCREECFEFDKLDPENVLNRAAHDLPVRPAGGGDGVDLIAEPWGGAYSLGGFPSGWAEWNDAYRDAFRRSQNKLGIEPVTPAELARRFAGSSDKFQPNGRRPWHSVNFLVAHDGFTLRDLYSYNQKRNDQPWPFGPSDGGSDDNKSWDQGGDPALQRQAARNGLAFLMLSAGVPMITGGDEMYRTQYGNNNAYNLDSVKNYLDYGDAVTFGHFFAYAKKLIAFRRAHPALRPADFFRGADGNGNGLKDITWLRDDGREADAAYLDNPDNHFLAYRIDGSEFGDGVQSIYVAYNGWKDDVSAKLPANLGGNHWHRVGDTAAWMEDQDNFKGPGQEERLDGDTYTLHGRSVLLLIEK